MISQKSQLRQNVEVAVKPGEESGVLYLFILTYSSVFTHRGKSDGFLEFLT